MAQFLMLESWRQASSEWSASASGHAEVEREIETARARQGGRRRSRWARLLQRLS
jgi:hypothetical protein